MLHTLLIRCSALITMCLISFGSHAQDYGNFPKIKKELLLRDLELLYQGLDRFHSGMYWYTPKDSVDYLFDQARKSIDRDLNTLEFHKIIAPLVGLSREDHTDIYLSEETTQLVEQEGTFFPFTIVFLDKKLYCIKNASDQYGRRGFAGKQILSINGEKPVDIVENIGTLFASDGFIKAVKYSDLEGFSFSKYYYYYYGNVPSFEIQFANEDSIDTFKPLKLPTILENLKQRYPKREKSWDDPESLEFKILHDSIAYLGVHTFSNSVIAENSYFYNNFKKFLENSFRFIQEKNIKVLIIDISQNGGGNEGNENLLYSYIGENYQKYQKVRAKTQVAILNNGIDPPIKLKTFGTLERWLGNKKIADGSYERKPNAQFGLMAFQKEPKYKFNGEIHVIISPVTYSGGSEFANMVYTNNLATFYGQETGGGYFGNTSGYSRALTLPHSQITIDLPALQFIMNVKGKSLFGRGVIPHHRVIPSLRQYIDKRNASLEHILSRLGHY